MKPLNDYLKMDFKIIISTIPKDEGGGYNAAIPQLGERLFQAYGDTPDEALNNLNEIKEIVFKEYIDKGLDIPEPVNETPEILSGKFMVRVPIPLHSQLKRFADRSGVSLNQYINYLLSTNSTIQDIKSDIQSLKECFYAFNKYQFDNSENDSAPDDYLKYYPSYKEVS